MFRVAFVLAVVALVGVGCYSPAYKDCAIACADNVCPSGLSCVAGMCRTGDSTDTCGSIAGSDAGLSDGDALADGPTDGGYPTGDFGSASLVSLGATGLVDPSLTPNMREIFVKKGSSIYVATRATLGSQWSALQPVSFSLAGVTDQTPCILPDDTTMLFSSSRTPTTGGYDLWMTTRTSTSANWDTPTQITVLDSVADDTGPNLSGDQKTIVFASTRNSANGNDLFIATRGSATDPWGAPRAITELDTQAASEVHPNISPDALTIYYQSTINGPADLFTAHRVDTSSMFDAPQPLSTLNDGSASDGDPWVSPDGHHIFFSSNRNGGAYQIYEAIR